MWGVYINDLFVTNKNTNNNNEILYDSLRYWLIPVAILINLLLNYTIESSVGRNTFSHKTPISFKYCFQLLKSTIFSYPIRHMIYSGNFQNGIIRISKTDFTFKKRVWTKKQQYPIRHLIYFGNLQNKTNCLRLF